jgi:soluble lytic murein transglycosylase-like protein
MVVRWGLPLAASLAFAGQPGRALADRSHTADLIELNSAGHPSWEDPRIALTPPPAGTASALEVGTNPRSIIVKAAADVGVDPNLLLAVSYWESGWRQDALSSEGAIGLLQLMPLTAEAAGPKLLGRPVNLQDPTDNAELGAALLKDLLNKYGARMGLAAYYQGEPALLSGNYAADTWHYADGIIALAAEIAAGGGPSGP